jgi:hypothetical protein
MFETPANIETIENMISLCQPVRAIVVYLALIFIHNVCRIYPVFGVNQNDPGTKSVPNPAIRHN